VEMFKVLLQRICITKQSFNENEPESVYRAKAICLSRINFISFIELSPEFQKILMYSPQAFTVNDSLLSISQSCRRKRNYPKYCNDSLD